ncbi:MAG: DUF1501 domain-containing protein [Pirellulales bacterium]
MRDKVLLVCCGEMGRTLKLNGGRDHWGTSRLWMMAARINQSGAIKLTRDGGEPASDPIYPDLIATVMHKLLDIDHRGRHASQLDEVITKGNRSLPDQQGYGGRRKRAHHPVLAQPHVIPQLL